MGAHRAPLLVRLLVGLLVPSEEREHFLGDLEESAARDRRGMDRRGKRRSWLWEVAGALQLRLAPRRKIAR
jgi:hypothetical protein